MKPGRFLTPFFTFFIASILIFSLGIVFHSQAVEGVSESIEDVGIEDIEVEFPDEFIAGFFNEVRFDSQEREVNITMYPEDDPDIEYQWYYDEEDGWEGDTGYLDEVNTSYIGGSWEVHISVDDEDPTDVVWTIEFEVEGETHALSVEVVRPRVSFTYSGDLRYFFEPYQDQTEGTDSISVRNTGNVKLMVEIYTDFPEADIELGGEIEHGDELAPDESATIELNYRRSTSGARIPTTFGTLTVEGRALSRVAPDPDEDFVVHPGPAFPIDASYTVGYEGFEQEGNEGFTVQYERSIEIDGLTEGEAVFYVYPEQLVSVDIRTENVTFDEEDVTAKARNGEELEEIDLEIPGSLSPEHEEMKITVPFESHHRNDGMIELMIEDEIYTTHVEIDEAVDPPEPDDDLFLGRDARELTLGVMVVGAIVLFGAVRILLSKKKEED